MTGRETLALRGDEPPNNERVRRALNVLQPHLDAYVRQTLRGVPGARVSSTADLQELLKIMRDGPVHFHGGPSGATVKNCVHQLLEARNRIAHSQPFSDREARHAIDTAGVLAEAMNAPREVINALDALNAPTGPAIGAQQRPMAPAPPTVRAPSPAESRSATPARPERVKRGADDEIINPNQLTADDVAMQRVRCPACEAHVFQEWSAGWDAHAAHKCSGLASTTESERKAEFRARFGHLFRDRGFAVPSKSQRDVMRHIFDRHWPVRDKVIAEYAAAERRGEVVRSRNRYNLSPEQYAHRLLEDGLKKGWLRPAR